MHSFSNAHNVFYLALATLVFSMSFWFRDIISEGTFLGNHTLAVQKGLNLGVIVRHWIWCRYGSTLWSEHCSNMFPAARLGERESLELNIASLSKAVKNRTIQRINCQAETSMSKDILLELHLLGASFLRAATRIGQVVCSELVFKITTLIWNHNNQNRISIHNVESGGSKGVWKPTSDTMGLPNVPRGYGNRGIVVPSCQWPLGRVPVCGLRKISTAAGGSSTVSTDALAKIRKIAALCEENPNFIITDKLYKLLYDRNLYQAAYNKLKSNPGNMTPGMTPTTLDGMSMDVVDDIINNIKSETFDFQPGRRVNIPKPNGKTRPLTIAPPRDKIVQECIRMILEAIYENSFSEYSHGFRPNRGCHSALKMLNQKFRVSSWFIEGDISNCFPSIDHNILIGTLEERIKDRRFINLIRKSLKAGYFEFKQLSISVAGTPQGSIISPILSNIFLDKFDKFIEELKSNFDVGSKASINPAWKRLENANWRAKTIEEKIEIRKDMLQVKSKLAIDPNFKRLSYIRYADDWIVGVRGSAEDCRQILGKIDVFLRESLKLELSKEKTKITNVNSDFARFLSVDIRKFQHTKFRKVRGRNTRVTDALRLTAPLERITAKLKANGFLKENRPAPRFIWMKNEKDEIILLYNSVYRGIMNYYRFVHNFNELSSWVHFILKASCAKLLAAKFSMKSQAKVFDKYGKDLKGDNKHGFVKASYGTKLSAFNTNTNDILLRVNAQGISKASLENLVCSVCESEYRVEMHHVRMMKDLNPKARFIDRLMAKKNRKQIALCRSCHMEHHKK